MIKKVVTAGSIPMALCSAKVALPSKLPTKIKHELQKRTANILRRSLRGASGVATKAKAFTIQEIKCMTAHAVQNALIIGRSSPQSSLLWTAKSPTATAG